MDKKALAFGARFALPPNSLGYCGLDSAPERFKNCIQNGVCDHIEDEFSHFIVLHPYLQTLAEITGKPKYSYEVLEAYWIGNELTKMAKPDHYELLLQNFEKQGVPDWLVAELKTTPPKKFIPTHLFQVLHVGVGRASGSVPFNIESQNSCMIRWGKVLEIKESKALIDLTCIDRKDGKFILVQKQESHPISDVLVKGIKVGNVVSVHWKQVTKILTKSEVSQLKFWTNEVLSSL